MGCVCHNRTVSLECVNCGTFITITYNRKTEEPLAVAKSLGKKCRKCKGEEFKIRQ